MLDNKKRLFEIMHKVDVSFNSSTILNETKAFAELRKLNKTLYDKTIELEKKIGNDVLNLIDSAIEEENLKYETEKEKELVYLIILDLILERYLDKSK